MNRIHRGEGRWVGSIKRAVFNIRYWCWSKRCFIANKINPVLFNFLFVRGMRRGPVARQVVIDPVALTTYHKDSLPHYFNSIKEETVHKFIHVIIAKGFLHPYNLRVEFFPYLENYDTCGIRVVCHAYRHYGWRRHLPMPASLREVQFQELLDFIPTLQDLWHNSTKDWR